MPMGEGQASIVWKLLIRKTMEGFYSYSQETSSLTNLSDQTLVIARQLHQAIPKELSKSIDWNKIQTCTQKSDDPVHDNYS